MENPLYERLCKDAPRGGRNGMRSGCGCYCTLSPLMDDLGKTGVGKGETLSPLMDDQEETSRTGKRLKRTVWKKKEAEKLNK